MTPLETLFESVEGSEVPLPQALVELYGALRFPRHLGRAHHIGNFVATLDGVVTLGEPGHESGGDISGFNEQDRMVMGLLRASADAVVVAAGTLRAEPDHVWTAEYIAPAYAGAYGELRTAWGKREPPLNVLVTGSGRIDLNGRVFHSGEAPVLIVTSMEGAARLDEQGVPDGVRVVGLEGSARLSARAILGAIRRVREGSVILVEGGPQLMGDFFAEGCLDELFLTLAPQVAGRDACEKRPGFVSGMTFAPQNPLWGRLAGVKRGGSHVFLRYSFSHGGMN